MIFATLHYCYYRRGQSIRWNFEYITLRTHVARDARLEEEREVVRVEKRYRALCACVCEAASLRYRLTITKYSLRVIGSCAALSVKINYSACHDLEFTNKQRVLPLGSRIVRTCVRTFPRLRSADQLRPSSVAVRIPLSHRRSILRDNKLWRLSLLCNYVYFERNTVKFFSNFTNASYAIVAAVENPPLCAFSQNSEHGDTNISNSPAEIHIHWGKNISKRSKKVANIYLTEMCFS